MYSHKILKELTIKGPLSENMKYILKQIYPVKYKDLKLMTINKPKKEKTGRTSPW